MKSSSTIERFNGSYVLKIGFLCFSLLLLASQWTFAQQRQSFSISGRVTDRDTKQVLPNANISIVGTNLGTTTDQDGNYRIDGLINGRYLVEVSYVGYHARNLMIVIDNKDHVADVSLRPKSNVLDEVVVSGENPNTKRAYVGYEKLEASELSDIPTVLENDIFKALQLLPGVSGSSDYSSALYIRGSGPEQTLVMLDRAVIYNPYHFFGFFSSFNPDAIGEVELHKGTYPANYGGRLSSVLAITNKTGDIQKNHGSFQIGTMAARVSLNGPVGKGTYMFAFRRSTMEPILKALQKSVDFVPMFYFYDVNMRLNMPLSKKTTFQLSAYSGLDDADFPIADESGLILHYGNSAITTNFRHLYSNKAFLNVGFSASTFNNTPALTSGGTTLERYNKISEYNIYAENHLHRKAGDSVILGVELKKLNLELNDQYDGFTTLQSEADIYLASLYADVSYKLGQRLGVSVGLRANYSDRLSTVIPSGRFALNYDLNQWLRLQASAGRYYQYLSLNTNHVFNGMDAWMMLTDEMDASTSDQISAGFSLRLGNKHNLVADVYYKDMDGIFDLDPYLVASNQNLSTDSYIVGGGFAQGFELKFERSARLFSGFVSYNLAETRRKFKELNRGLAYPPRYDVQHTVSVASSFHFNPRLKLDVVYNYKSGQAYTNPTGRTIFSNLDMNVVVPGRVNASRLPDYQRLDIGLVLTKNHGFFGLANKTRWKFQVVNTFNRKNVWFNQMEISPDLVEYSSIPQLPILPNISYEAHF